MTFALACSVPSTQAAQSDIPVMDFVRDPTYGSVKISPTGEYPGMTVARGEIDVLTVLRTRDMSIMKVNQLPNEKSVGAFH